MCRIRKLQVAATPCLHSVRDNTVYMAWIDTYVSQTTIGSSIIDSQLYGLYWASSSNVGRRGNNPPRGISGFGFEAGAFNANTGNETWDTLTVPTMEWIAVDRSNSKYRNSLYVAWTFLGTTASNILVRRKIAGVDSMQPAVKASSDDFAVVQFTSLGIDAKGGLHVTFMGSYDTANYGIYTVYSSDGGATFGPAVKISDADIPTKSADAADGCIFGVRAYELSVSASFDRYGEDKESLRNMVCPRSGGRWRIWLGNLFQSTLDRQWFHMEPAAHSQQRSGSTELGPIDHFYPSIAVDGMGKISITWYDRREDPNDVVGRYYIGQSTDQGQTWTNAPVATSAMDFSAVMDVNQNFGIGEYTQVLATPNYTIPIWSDGRDNTGQLRVYAAFLNSATAGITRLSTVSEGLELSDNYPNPFGSTTNLSFTLGTSAHAELYVTNLTGISTWRASIWNNRSGRA